MLVLDGVQGMLRNLVCLTGALALLVAASMAGAQVPTGPTPVGVPISDLAGLGPAAVRARLADVPAEWPVPRAFEFAAPEGPITFITVSDLMLDPVLAQRLAVFRTEGDPVPTGPYLQCREVLTRDNGSPEPARSVVLMFRDGRLVSALQPIDPPGLPIPSASDRKAQLAFVRRPVTTPFIAHFGELPLEDGLGFLARLPKTVLAPGDRLSAACSSPPPPRPVTSAPRHGLDAGDMQGLALLPFAVTLPAKNHQRVAARGDGAALLATLRVGEPLAAAPATFAAGHKGVRAYPAAGGDYAVLSLDLGGYPGRNLTDFNDAALVGVRAGRIEWTAAPAGFGPHPGLLCLDDHGVPNTPRPGCTGWGHFSP
jgi:hypothetical protein